MKEAGLKISDVTLTNQALKVIKSQPFSSLEKQPFYIHFVENGQEIELRPNMIGSQVNILISFLGGINFEEVRGEDGKITEVKVSIPEDNTFTNDLDLIHMFLETLFRTLSK